MLFRSRRTTITEEQFFEELESHCPGAEEKLRAFLDCLEASNVHRDFGSDALMLRWRPEDGRAWKLGTVPSNGNVILDHLGSQAKGANLLHLHKQYLARLADIVPGASVKKTPSETGWYVIFKGQTIKVDELLADQARSDRWAEAVREFQSEAMKAAEGDE